MAARLYDTEELDYRTAEAILTHGQAMVSRETPLFIFKYGPPGSGKSTSDDTIYKTFKLSSNDFIFLDFDELIESSRELRVRTSSIRGTGKYGRSINFPDENLRPILDEINKIRWEISGRMIPNAQIGASLNFTDKLRAILQTSIDKNYNIMFDVTGVASQHEYYKRVLNCIPEIYKIIFVYPILSQTSQKIRTFSRANTNFSKEDEQKMYGRLRLDDARVLAAPPAKEFFLNTVIPMMYAGLIHQIIMVNNEDKPDVNFKATIPLEAVRADPRRHVPLRISDTFPVTIDAEGAITRAEQVADEFKSDNERLDAKIAQATRLFNTIRHDVVAAEFAKKPEGGGAAAGGAGGAPPAAFAKKPEGGAAANAGPLRAGASKLAPEPNVAAGAHKIAEALGGARRKYKKTRKVKRY
jgi:hypothetical protein